MKIALAFGADAVYLGLPDFSLRARVNNFTPEQLEEAAEYCRERGKQFYLTLNIYAHQRHLEKLPEQIALIRKLQPSAVIASDPGVITRLKAEVPEIPLHLSTQANVTNAEAARFWWEQGIERVILARELSLSEIKQIKKAVPELELECFVHGAMCMAYSGRCLLSSWITGRGANVGDCAQPCRWSYRLQNEELFKIQDDQERFEIELEEDQNGTYLFNSYDINLIDQLNKLLEAGVESFKIEGRSKSVYYVAVATRAYRKVLDAAFDFLQDKLSQNAYEELIKEQKQELEKLSHRGYWTGFLLGQQPPHLTDQDAVRSDWEFVGIAASTESGSSSSKPSTKLNPKKSEGKWRAVFAHNALRENDQVEVVTPEENYLVEIKKIENSQGEQVDSAHGGQNEIFSVEFSQVIEEEVFLLRKKIS